VTHQTSPDAALTAADTVLASADCPHGEGPGDGSGCIKPAGHNGDHIVTSGVAVLSCSRAVLRQSHIPHSWWPQPGMAYVHCPGIVLDNLGEETTR
jgi:hypothetical protein